MPRFLFQVRVLLLLTPGPVTTRPEVRRALDRDAAPWDNDSCAVYAGIRTRLLRLAGGVADLHAVLPLPGSGHFVTEAALRSVLAAGERLLIPATGDYAARMARLAHEAGRVPVLLPIAPEAPVAPAAITAALDADPSLRHVGIVQSETSTGVVHDVAAIGAAVRPLGRRLIVDAVSAFGALTLDLAAQPEIAAAVFTANKCLESLPGIGFAVARIDRLQAAGAAGSWSLDLADILAHGQRNGPGFFRFTPPAQILAALGVALDLLDAEGGPPARLTRYTATMRTLYDGLDGLGLAPWLPAAAQGPIVVNVRAPPDPAWSLQAFVDALKARGYLVSNFCTTPTPSIRIGCIGAITSDDMRGALAAMDEALTELGIHRRKAA